ncbi:hypothetical protein ACQ4PT_067861 [Festuca glaucescens]
MLPLLLISTLPAFTLLLVAPASYKPWKLARELGLVALLIARELLSHSASAAAGRKDRGARRMPPPPKARQAPPPPPALAMDDALPLLDLPELALDRVLEELAPASLAAMACVCAGLRDRCSMDSLWARHVRGKWGRVLGAAAREEWEAELAARAAAAARPRPNRRRSWADSLACAWPFSWIGCRWVKGDTAAPAVHSALAPPADTVVAWYRALECGEFWFPAQVYNREDGHVGFLLSCYDAHLRYDRRTDTFTARYPPHGRKPAKEEDGVQWCRVRSAPVSTPAQDLHISGCLDGLHPGDHFEIQWRKNKDFPYDTIMLEFKHYAAGSRWRQTTVSRKDHREKGDEADGFYGGIRKLQTKDEISTWRRFWPVDVLS